VHDGIRRLGATNFRGAYDGGHGGGSPELDNVVVDLVNQVVVLWSTGHHPAMASDRPGYQLPLLLIGAFRVLVDDLHAELDRRGFSDTRPVHGFALQALGREGATTSELGRRLGITKQAAAKTVARLETCGLVAREPDDADRRSRRLTVTRRGELFLAASAEILAALRARWINELGAARVTALEDDLETVVRRAGGVPIGDLPGWLGASSSAPS
jgi:DNA-binding MarR family transcriptional regulator